MAGAAYAVGVCAAASGGISRVVFCDMVWQLSAGVYNVPVVCYSRRGVDRPPIYGVGLVYEITTANYWVHVFQLPVVAVTAGLGGLVLLRVVVNLLRGLWRVY